MIHAVKYSTIFDELLVQVKFKLKLVMGFNENFYGLVDFFASSSSVQVYE